MAIGVLWRAASVALKRAGIICIITQQQLTIANGKVMCAIYKINFELIIPLLVKVIDFRTCGNAH